MRHSSCIQMNDVGLKAKKKGYKMLMVPSAVAWHQHINLPGRERRLPFSDYLMARNKVYLGREYFGELRAINIFIFIAVRECVRCALAILKRKSLEPSKYALYGAWNGLKGNMEIPAEMKLY